jgi:hypothetical protein
MPAPITEFVDVTVNIAGASIEKFSFGTLMGVFAHTVNTDRQNGPFFSIAEVNAAGFTAAAEAATNAWATAAFAQDDGVDQILIGLQAAADAGDWTVTMDAVELAGSDTWYITNIESRADADIADLGAWTEARKKIYVAQSDDLTVTAALALQSNNYNRSGLIFHDDDSEYLDGAWSSSGGGLNLDTPGGVGIWAYRSLEGVPFDDVTGAQATTIYGADANLFGRNKGLNFTSKGTMASGRHIDVQTTIDWIAVRMEEEILALFVGTPTKIPYTNAGINTIVAAVQDVLNRGVSFGHLSPDFPLTIIAPDVADVSAQDKIDRVLTLTVEAVIAGAIQKVVMTINLTF